MKKLLCLVVMFLFAVSTAQAKPATPLNYTLDNIFEALEKAVVGTNFLIDASGAENTCGVACSTKLEIDTDSYLLITSQKDTKAVTGINFILQVGYEEKEKIAEAILRAAQALETTINLVAPKTNEETRHKLHSRVGITAKGLVQSGELREVTYKNAKLSGIFSNGTYLLFVAAVQK